MEVTKPEDGDEAAVLEEDGTAAAPVRQLALPGRGCMTVLSRSTFFPCPVLKKAKVENAVPAAICRVKSNSAASAELIPST